MINFIGLDEQKIILGDKIQKRIQGVIDHGKFILGPEVNQLEERLADYVGVKHCISCSSGTDALLMSLMASGIGKNDAVITSPFSYIATAEVIELLGARVYFCDISEQTYNLDCSKLDYTIDQISKDGLDLKAIIAVDIFGLPARFRLLEKLCKEKGIILIEDMAQSFGSSIRERKAGSFGDFSATSFFPSKPLGCYGDGGAIFTSNDEHADILKSIRVHGSGKNKYDNIRVGINGRLDTIQAAILLEKIEIFDHELLLREEVSEIYKSSISDEYIFQYIPEGYKSANAIFSVITHSNKNREKIISKFSEENIPIMVYYPISLNKQPVFRNLYNFPAQKNSEDISSKIFAIPFHPYIKRKDQEKIIGLLNEV
jgi:UDP-2-acetamido-2-deoxy-ribo-hexuluronate aminotransferase